jgi:hypothetical protein
MELADSWATDAHGLNVPYDSGWFSARIPTHIERRWESEPDT